jgi:hypothetical protein
VLVAFEERRSQQPEGAERIAGLVGVLRAPVFSLHSGDARAGTWFDREEQVVWLVGVGHGHNYDHLIDLARRSQLLPTPDDYLALEGLEVATDVIEEFLWYARWLPAEAAQTPDRPVEARIAGRIGVRVCLETGDPPFLVVAISERVAGGGPRLPAEWRMVLIGLFFPGVPFDEFVPFPMEMDKTYVREDELAYRHFALVDEIKARGAEIQVGLIGEPEN